MSLLDRLVPLDNWSATVDAKEPRLRGFTNSYTARGRGIITSPIKYVVGLIVETQTGTLYVLGNVDGSFDYYMKQHYPGWDADKPDLRSRHENEEA